MQTEFLSWFATEGFFTLILLKALLGVVDFLTRIGADGVAEQEPCQLSWDNPWKSFSTLV